MASGLWRTKSVEQSIKDTDESGHKLKRTLSALAVLSCLWLMINLTAFTWLRFFGWMLIGIAVYFAYGRSHSILGRREGGAHGLAREEIRATYEAQRDAGGRDGSRRRSGGSSPVDARSPDGNSQT